MKTIKSNKKSDKKLVDRLQLIEQASKNKNEFMDFLKDYNVLDLAIGVVVGTAAKDMVNALVADVIMPIIAIFTPNASWRDWSVQLLHSQFKFGDLIFNLINFLIIALVVFLLIIKLFRVPVKKD